MAYDVTIRSPFTSEPSNRDATAARRVADDAGRAKRGDQEAEPAVVPPDRSHHGTALSSRLGWRFASLAFDSLGTPSDEIT